MADAGRDESKEERRKDGQTENKKHFHIEITQCKEGNQMMCSHANSTCISCIYAQKPT